MPSYRFWVLVGTQLSVFSLLLSGEVISRSKELQALDVINQVMSVNLLCTKGFQCSFVQARAAIVVFFSDVKLFAVIFIRMRQVYWFID